MLNQFTCGIRFMALAGLVGCGVAGGPLDELPYPCTEQPTGLGCGPYDGLIVGSSREDLFGYATVADESATQVVDELQHFDGRRWDVLPLAAELEEQATSAPGVNGYGALSQLSMVSAGEGEVWVTRPRWDNQVTLLRLDASGAVVSDRSADIPWLPDAERLWLALYAGGGGVFLTVQESGGAARRAIYRLDGESFVPLANTPEGIYTSYATTTVVGPDEAYFPGNDASPAGWHYAAGVWDVMPIEYVGRIHVGSATDVWIVPNEMDPTRLLHGSGMSFSTVAVQGYALTEANSDTRNPGTYAPHLGGDGELALMSFYRSAGRNGMDFANGAYVTGLITSDGTYVGERSVRNVGQCVSTCDAIGFTGGLANGEQLFSYVTYRDDTADTAERTFLVWTP